MIQPTPPSSGPSPAPAGTGQSAEAAAPASDTPTPQAGTAGTALARGIASPWMMRGLLPAAVLLAVLLAALAAGAIVLAYSAQQRVELLEGELGKRQQDSAQSANEARLLARQAETAARDVVAKMAQLEVRVGETAMQRSQIEDLLQSLARSRDENVLADVEATVRVAQQQSAITGSAEPLLLVLRQAEERLARYGQPRLERVRRAVAQDLERVRAAGGADPASLAVRLDEVMRQIDELPLLAVPQQAAGGRRGPVAGAGPGAPPAATAAMGAPAATAASSPAAVTATKAASSAAPGSTGVAAPTVPAGPAGPWPGWVATLRDAWVNLTTHAWSETRALLRVTRIDDPEAMLIAPEQAYFLRENLKLRLLNARLALLSRQFDVAQSDLRASLAALERYFDRSARRTVLATEALRQVMAQARMVPLPRPDATLAAIAAASAGR